MKQYLYKTCVLFMVFAVGSLVACQEVDEVMQPSFSKNPSTLHGEIASRAVTCEVETAASGQLLAKLDSIAAVGNYNKEDITDLTIKGPVTREDLRILRPFQKMNKLDLTDIIIIDEWGNASTNFPESVLDSLASPAHVYLPTSITYMGWDGFRHSQITGVYMPDNITGLSSGIFYDCPNLTSVRLSEKLKELSWGLFQNCPSLATIEIPESVIALQGYSLSGTGLKSFDIPESITTIGDGVFDNCKYLEKITWSPKITEIPYYCFDGCEKLQFEIPDYITLINNYAFANCSGFTNIHLPATVETWGDGIFQGCSNLETVTGIEKWEEIPDRMFNSCDKLNIEMPQQLVSIGDRTFERCYALQNPKLPSTLKVIKEGAFCDCNSITEIILPEGIETIGAYAFQNIPITEITFPASLKEASDRPLNYCHKLKVVYWKTATEMPRLASHAIPFIYAKAGIAYDKNNGTNLIFGDDETGYTAESFYLEDQDYYCPKSFTAKKAVFRRWTGLWDYFDSSPRVWQTISLPFTATKFVVQENGEQPQRDLKPFGSSDMGDAKPFWLRSLHSDGFQRETVLEAGKPYIISFPNSDQYLPEYNINGTIEYWGENTVVMASTDALTPAVGPDFTMHATFNWMGHSEYIYTLEYRDVYDENGNYQYWGQAWVPDWSNVNHFQAYATPNGTAARSYSMNDGSTTSRSAKRLGPIPQESDID